MHQNYCNSAAAHKIVTWQLAYTISAGAGAAVLAFSTTDRASFNALPSWKSKLQEQCIDIPMVLVQNKVDLLDQVSRSIRCKQSAP